MTSIVLIGLISLITVVTGQSQDYGQVAMYNQYVSPFSVIFFGIRARDGAPTDAGTAADDNVGKGTDEEPKQRLNSQRIAITKAGYTCGIVGTGEIDPFELGPKFAPLLPVSPKKMKRRQKTKALQKAPTTEADSEHPESISASRSLWRFKRDVVRSSIGEDAKQTQICWQVKVRIDFGNGTMKVCGGTIIGARTILTAAHCLIDRKRQKSISPSTITVQIGDETNDNGPAHCVEVFSVDVVIPHPSYDINLEDNDIGLLILSSEIDLVNKPCACKLCVKDKEPKAGDVCVVAGYGQSSEQAGSNPSSLRWHKQRVLKQTFDSRCAFHVGSGKITNLDGFICAGDIPNDRSCPGDDGTPFLCFDQDSDSHYAAGIVSFSAGCGKHIGSQYTKVRKYLNWIEENGERDILVQRGWNREIARQL